MALTKAERGKRGREKKIADPQRREEYLKKEWERKKKKCTCQLLWRQKGRRGEQDNIGDYLKKL